MFTRGVVSHQYTPYAPPRANIPGAIVDRPTGAFNSNKNVVAAMPIARPNSSPVGDGAPFYLDTYSVPRGAIVHGGMMMVTPLRPRLEMDPSDPTTWQRQYRFDPM